MIIYLLRPRISLILLLTLTAFFRVRGEYMWRSALIGNTMAEIILQFTANIYAVVTGRQFYGQWSGALAITIFLFLTTVLSTIGVAYTLFAMRPMDASGNDLTIKHYGNIALSHSFANRVLNWIFIIMFIGWSYLLNWIFFAALIVMGTTNDG